MFTSRAKVGDETRISHSTSHQFKVVGKRRNGGERCGDVCCVFGLLSGE